TDLAAKEPGRVRELAAAWDDWARRVHIEPWPTHPPPQKEGPLPRLVATPLPVLLPTASPRAAPEGTSPPPPRPPPPPLATPPNARSRPRSPAHRRKAPLTSWMHSRATTRTTGRRRSRGGRSSTACSGSSPATRSICAVVCTTKRFP